MRFIAGVLLGLLIAAIGHAQADQLDDRKMEVLCDLHPFDARCL